MDGVGVFGMTHDMFAPGLASMVVPVRRKGESPVGIIGIAGPTDRLSADRFQTLNPVVEAANHDIAVAGATSPLFASRRVVSNEAERPQ
jgi:IclR family transcriptional regulator, acetate operon repressor